MKIKDCKNNQNNINNLEESDENNKLENTSQEISTYIEDVDDEIVDENILKMINKLRNLSETMINKNINLFQINMIESNLDTESRLILNNIVKENKKDNDDAEKENQQIFKKIQNTLELTNINQLNSSDLSESIKILQNKDRKSVV